MARKRKKPNLKAALKLSPFWTQPMFPAYSHDDDGRSYTLDYSPLYKKWLSLVLKDAVVERRDLPMPDPVSIL